MKIRGCLTELVKIRCGHSAVELQAFGAINRRNFLVDFAPEQEFLA
jgi:hypothetical protein